MKQNSWIAVAIVLVLLGAGLVWCCWWPDDVRAPASDIVDDGEASSVEKAVDGSEGGEPVVAEGPAAEDVTASSDEAENSDPEEVRANAEERLVEAFDSMVDGWMEPAEKSVTMQEVSAFVAAFNRVPKDRKAECLRRALNLVPDENAMLLVGVLMDKTQDRELVELVFNDFLNRDEDVKMPVLREIVKDRAHPNYADAAWILDVTDGGEEAK